MCCSLLFMFVFVFAWLLDNPWYPVCIQLSLPRSFVTNRRPPTSTPYLRHILSFAFGSRNSSPGCCYVGRAASTETTPEYGVHTIDLVTFPRYKLARPRHPHTTAIMENPVQDVRAVVHNLTQGSPSQQEDAINRYFTPDASFTHPFCRTGSFEGSRHLVHRIYRWYKIMSPKIELQVNSIGKQPGFAMQ